MDSKPFLQKASWTLVDQGVVSAGNFLLNVVLARKLSEPDYGEFALFLGAIFFLRTIDYSFISYPVSLRLCVVDDDERARLLGNTALLTLGLSVALVIPMALGTLLLDEAGILVPACLCYLCWQAQETARRFLFADFRYREAVAGDGIAYVGQVVLVFALLWIDSITLSSALYVMSATFAAGALAHVARLRFAWPDLSQTWRLARDYVSIGTWSLVSYQLVLLRWQLFPWMLAAVAGMAATASFQAAGNIASMMNPVIFGIGNAIPQISAQAHQFGGVSGAARAAYRYVLFGLAPILVICAAGLLMPGLLLEAAYGASSPYVAAVVCLQLFAIAGVLDYVAEMISKTLLGVQAGKLAFVVNIVGVVIAVVPGFALVESMGVVGACLALVIANLVRLIGAGMAISWLMIREKADRQAGLAPRGSAVRG